MNKIYWIPFFVLSFACNTLFAQQAEINLLKDEYVNIHISTNDVLQFNTNNYSDESLRAYIEIDISDRNGTTTAILNTAIFDMAPGVHTAESILFRNPLQVRFSAEGFETANKRNFSFPSGEYMACINLYDHENNLIDRKCQQLEVLNTYQLLLIYPFNREAVTESRPVFSWTPLFASQKVTYKVRWIESEFEEVVEADFLTHIPFYEATFLTNNVFPYPVDAPKLNKKKFYFWKVEAFMGTRLIAESEIWQFHFSEFKFDEEEQVWYVDEQSFDTEQICYFAGDKIGIKVDNFKHAASIGFRLENGNGNVLFDEDDKLIAEATHGLNTYVIDLSHLLQIDKTYTLKILNDGKVKNLRIVKIH